MTFVIVLFVFSLWFLGGGTNFILILCKSGEKKGWAEQLCFLSILSSSKQPDFALPARAWLCWSGPWTSESSEVPCAASPGCSLEA